jgi:hypothetical protein
MIICLCFKLHEQLFSYLATAPSTPRHTALYGLIKAQACQTVISREADKIKKITVLLAKELSQPILNVLTFDATDPSGARTHDLPFPKQELYH